MAHVEVNDKLCKGCGLCTTACRKELLYLSEEFNAKGYNVARQKAGHGCVGCKLCAVICPDIAITVYK